MAGFNMQQAMVRGLLALPRPLLRLMSGGGVVYKGGRTLDARFQFLANAGKGAPPMSSLNPEEARAASAGGLEAVAGRPERALTLEDFTVAGVNGDVRVRAYRPDEQDTDAPLMVFAHMGGGVIGDLETCHVLCSMIAVIAKGPVLSVDYRLAPENRYPKGLEDVLSVYRWARDNTTKFDAPTGRVAIGGDSMGGNFAAVIAQEMKRTGEAQPELQLLIYPAVDVASETPSMTTFADAYPLSAETMRWFMGHYVPPDANPANPRLSPIKAEDLTGLAPAIVVTAGFDPLVDEGEAYARRLKEAGVSVTYRCYDHLAHGFCAFTGAVPAADKASREIAGLVRTAYEGAPR